MIIAVLDDKVAYKLHRYLIVCFLFVRSVLKAAKKLFVKRPPIPITMDQTIQQGKKILLQFAVNQQGLFVTKCFPRQKVPMCSILYQSWTNFVGGTQKRGSRSCWKCAPTFTNRIWGANKWKLLHSSTSIRDICQFFYTTAIWGLEILHLKVRKFASRQNSVKKLCV